MRFEETPEGYLDTDTGLVWKEEDEPNDMPYSEAMRLSDEEWRIPNIRELLSLVNYGRENPATGLPNMKPHYYWSCTSQARTPEEAWAARFKTGSSDYRLQRSYLSVRMLHR